MQCCVYILASKRNGTFYTGVTSNLPKRIYEHKSDSVEGFTKTYHVHVLVWYECTEDINSAITREKQIKAWKRGWKLELIEKENPEWKDLYDELQVLSSCVSCHSCESRNPEKKNLDSIFQWNDSQNQSEVRIFSATFSRSLPSYSLPTQREKESLP